MAICPYSSLKVQLVRFTILDLRKILLNNLSLQNITKKDAQIESDSCFKSFVAKYQSYKSQIQKFSRLLNAYHVHARELIIENYSQSQSKKG